MLFPGKIKNENKKGSHTRKAQETSDRYLQSLHLKKHSISKHAYKKKKDIDMILKQYKHASK